MRNIKLISLLVVLVMLLAACGGNDNDAGSSGEDIGGNGGDATEVEDAEGDDGAEEGEEGEDGEEGEGDEGAGAAQQITFAAGNELAYNPETATATVGTVNITLDNTGALEHNIVWVEEGDPENPFVYTAPGESASNTRDFDSPGEYQFYCSIPGHREAGMTGALTITE
jgi:plastocyanin